MEAKQGLIFVICLMIMAQEMACYPNGVRAKLNCISEDDLTALAEQKDWKSTLKSIIKHIPFKTLVLPIIRKILKGIKESKNPIDVLLDILSVLGEGKEEKSNENKEETNEEEKEESNTNEEENNKNEEESNTNEEESNKNEEENNANEEEKTEGEEGDSGSGQEDEESQNDANAIHHKFKINGPDEW